MREVLHKDFVKLEAVLELIGGLVVVALAGASGSGKIWILDLSVEGVSGGIEPGAGLAVFLLLTAVILIASAVFIQIDKITTAVLENEVRD